jgi:hypothetical protein
LTQPACFYAHTGEPEIKPALSLKIIKKLPPSQPVFKGLRNQKSQETAQKNSCEKMQEKIFLESQE